MKSAARYFILTAVCLTSLASAASAQQGQLVGLSVPPPIQRPRPAVGNPTMTSDVLGFGYERTAQGVYRVLGIRPGSLAATSGLQDHDFITHIDRQPVDFAGSLEDTVRANGAATLSIARFNGVDVIRRQIRLMTGQGPIGGGGGLGGGGNGNGGGGGIVGNPVAVDTNLGITIELLPSGHRVTGFTANSKARFMGVRVGDLITHLNRRPIGQADTQTTTQGEFELTVQKPNGQTVWYWHSGPLPVGGGFPRGI